MNTFDVSAFLTGPRLDAAVAALPPLPRGFVSKEQRLLDAMQVLAAGSDFTLADLRSKRKYRKLSRCRELIAYVLHDLQGFSYPEIGRAMDMDHSGVLYAARRFRARQENNRLLAGAGE